MHVEYAPHAWLEPKVAVYIYRYLVIIPPEHSRSIAWHLQIT